MLTELEIEEIQRDLANGAEGRRMVVWVHKLLMDREERIHHEREVAVELLAKAPVHPAHTPSHEHHEPPHQAHRPRPFSRA